MAAAVADVAVVFEKLAVKEIEKIAEQVLGEIIQAIEQLITNKADEPGRSSFTQTNVTKATGLCSDPVNCMVVFQHDGHDASDLTNNGYKMGMIKCPCPHAGNTLLYECYVGKKAATFKLTGDGGFINWSFGGKFNRHQDGKTALVSFEEQS